MQHVRRSASDHFFIRLFTVMCPLEQLPQIYRATFQVFSLHFFATSTLALRVQVAIQKVVINERFPAV
jgi:hypothetical protein